MSFFSNLSEWLNRGAAPAPPHAGLYHFLNEKPQEKTRIHLRVEQDGYALLLINASRALHLNPTAAYLAFLYLNKTSPDKAASALTRYYDVPAYRAAADFKHISTQLDDLINPLGPCPVCDMELETTVPFSSQPSAPYRMDLAITYRCNNDCAHCYNARARNHPELNTQQWFSILDQLWQLSIPHIVFTGGEPTLREDLPQLIAKAEANGQITGINTNGRRLARDGYIEELKNAGLDHIQITFESHFPEIHDRMVNHPGAWQETVKGLENALKSGLYVMTNTTMLNVNADSIEDTLHFLANMGVPTIGLNALIYSGRGRDVGTGLPESRLPSLLNRAREITEANHQRLIWYTPTQYCNFDPEQLELGVKGCTAALYNMCIEPDGSVLPCQSYYQSLGNIQTDAWDQIWNHPLALSLRERRQLPSACKACLFEQECGGGCPLARSAGETCPPIAINPLLHEETETLR